MSEVAVMEQTNGVADIKRSRGLSSLNRAQLERRSKISTAFTYGSAIVSVPAFATALASIALGAGAGTLIPLGITVSALLGATLFGNSAGSADDALEDLKRREADEGSKKIQEQRALWLQAKASELSQSSGIDLAPEEIEALSYPTEDPNTRVTIRYGTIQKLIGDSGESVTLEKITLVWDGNRFVLLCEKSNLRELNGKALA